MNYLLRLVQIIGILAFIAGILSVSTSVMGITYENKCGVTDNFLVANIVFGIFLTGVAFYTLNNATELTMIKN